MPFCSADGSNVAPAENTASTTCKCAKDSDCTGSLLYNRCEGGTCVCGNTKKACSAGTTTPQCLGANSKALVNGGTTETCKCSVTSKSCTGADANFCDEKDGLCKCGTSAACTGSTPNCVNSATKDISLKATLQDNSNTPKCSCYYDTKSGDYACSSKSIKDCKAKSCTGKSTICCGSILSSLSTFQQMWITKQEYDEC